MKDSLDFSFRFNFSETEHDNGAVTIINLESIDVEHDGIKAVFHKQRPEKSTQTKIGFATDEPTVKLLSFFSPENAEPHLRSIMKAFADSALEMVKNFPLSPERTIALRKLLEARDAAIRAAL